MAGGVNLYAYAGNNPISFSDPFGLCNKDTDPHCTLVGEALAKAQAWLSGTGGKIAGALGQAANVFINMVDAVVPGFKRVNEGVAGLTTSGDRLSPGGQVASVALGLAEGGAAGKANDVADAVLKIAKEVKIGRTAKNAGDFVNIDFGDGTIVNIRVETHPPHGLHGNVQVWRPGEDPVNTHVYP